MDTVSTATPIAEKGTSIGPYRLWTTDVTGTPLARAKDQSRPPQVPSHADARSVSE